MHGSLDPKIKFLESGLPTTDKMKSVTPGKTLKQTLFLYPKYVLSYPGSLIQQIGHPDLGVLSFSQILSEGFPIIICLGEMSTDVIHSFELSLL